MLSVIEDLNRLAIAISQDREVHVYSKDVLLGAHVVGDGFVNDSEDSEEAGTDEKAHPDAAELSLFVGDDDSGDVLMHGDTEYADSGAEEEEYLDQDEDGEKCCEDMVNWLNSLGDQIASYSL